MARSRRLVAGAKDAEPPGTDARLATSGTLRPVVYKPDRMPGIEERRADIAGTEVFWREAESKTTAPVLYLHGVPTSGADWLPFLERTGGIAPDLPGFGRSDKSAGFDYSIAGYAKFLQALVGQLALQRISMVVHDWGSVGLALAQER